MLTSANATERLQLSMKVLLIEDSRLLRYVIIENLNDAKNISIEHFAETQSQALHLLDSQQFDLMLVDIELADGNGFEVIKHVLKDDYAFKRPVSVILTNNVDPIYRKLAKTLGVDYFFDKSLEFEDAMELVRHVATKLSAAAI